MGKIVEKKKKKGRPSLLDIQKRTLKEQQQQSQTNPNPNPNPNFPIPLPNSDPNSRFAANNPKSNGIAQPPVRIVAGDEEEGEEDDRNDDKKFKFVVRLKPNSRSFLSSRENSTEEGENCDDSIKKRKIEAVGSRSGGDEDGEKEEKHNSALESTDSPSGMATESSPTTPLPDPKLLVFILDRLQKKDTYQVYAEPVDPEELPDYHEIVEHPMDFGTVRKKLSSGCYANLEQFESDVFLICSNAMKYNAPDTIYFRQARSIQELAKKDFENLRQDSDDNRSQPKVARRGRPPTKNLKKRLGRPPIERAGSELSSDATLANAGDNSASNSYDLRRGPLFGKAGAGDLSGRNIYGSRSNEAFAWSAHQSLANDEFPASMLKGTSMKFGKKHIVLDEHRRNTYKQSHPSVRGHSPSVLATFDGEKKQLMAVGLHMEHGFARSLARFAATLGPVAWRIASKKIERALPAGVKFGPGWVGENETPSSQSSLPTNPPANVSPPQSFSHPNTSSSISEPTVIDVKVPLPKGKEPSNISALDVHFDRTKSNSAVASSPPMLENKCVEPTSVDKETTGGIKSESGISLSCGNIVGMKPNPLPQIYQEPTLSPSKNGVIGGFQNVTSQMDEPVRPFVPVDTITSTAPQHSEVHCNIVQPTVTGDTLVSPKGEAQVASDSGPCQSSEHPKTDSVPPDLNVGCQSPASPSSTTRQSDLVLQL